jgi:hypothetical protein
MTLRFSKNDGTVLVCGFYIFDEVVQLPLIIPHEFEIELY